MCVREPVRRASVFSGEAALGIRKCAVAVILILAPALFAQQAAGQAEQTVLKPRVLLRAPNRSGGWSALVNPAMDMSKEFQETCPGIRVSINLYMADYTVELNRVDHGVVAENQMMIANKDGDLISRVREWGGLKGGVKKACAAILADWGKR
jgi:hypothetical protein